MGAHQGADRKAGRALTSRGEAVLRSDQSRLWTPDNGRRLTCAADRAPAAAPTTFYFRNRSLTPRPGPRPCQVETLVVEAPRRRGSCRGWRGGPAAPAHVRQECVPRVDRRERRTTRRGRLEGIERRTIRVDGRIANMVDQSGSSSGPRAHLQAESALEAARQQRVTAMGGIAAG